MQLPKWSSSEILPIYISNRLAHIKDLVSFNEKLFGTKSMPYIRSQECQHPLNQGGTFLPSLEIAKTFKLVTFPAHFVSPLLHCLSPLSTTFCHYASSCFYSSPPLTNITLLWTFNSCFVFFLVFLELVNLQALYLHMYLCKFILTFFLCCISYNTLSLTANMFALSL